MSRQPATDASAHRVAIVVITAWTEPGTDDRRLRVTTLPTLASELEVSRVCTSIDEALAIARRRLTAR